jgi:hypothetical protein
MFDRSVHDTDTQSDKSRRIIGFQRIHDGTLRELTLRELALDHTQPVLRRLGPALAHHLLHPLNFTGKLLNDSHHLDRYVPFIYGRGDLDWLSVYVLAFNSKNNIFLDVHPYNLTKHQSV